ncbi:aldolase [Cyanobium sp. BA5m-10]|uniref:aldolase/citrate lyase family protein n=1 Tax=Cyanobium sp. BA5m-10 TaxID=2823705 RepID=UPI0020CE20EC|nr:aldolase/citrate lyase family protein [Cyanobium sp. BA5m-10]MCP9904720.1 aldolase [Cyanobium sp. BA5m-10]
MNSSEKKMLEILHQGKEEYGVLATKAEFEAEGTRTDELLRLLEIANKANVGLALKVGGCEAIRDMLEARQFGVRYIIAPMVETPYALTKYIAAKDKVYSTEEQEDVSFLFNLETITAFNNLEAMLEIAAAKPGCNGVVFGRVDFSGSIGAGRNGIESENVTKAVEVASKACRDRGLDFIVGGAVSIDALANLQRIKAIHLDRFETRKVIFSGSALDSPDLAKALRQAVHFELLWLLNKREYYGLMHREDQTRIQMLEDRWKVLNSD